MSFLDVLLQGIKSVSSSGTPQRPVRPILNFLSGFTLTDNPTLGTTDIAVTGGGGGSVPPLTRTVFVDSGTSASTHDGSIGKPYASISAALTAIGVPTSSGDANTQYVIQVSPGTYTESLTVPAYRSVSIVCDAPQVITGSVVWANSAGGGAVAPAGSVLKLQRLYVTGNVTVMDDGSVPSLLFVIDDGSNIFGANVGGNIVATGATKLAEIAIEGAYVAGNVTSVATSNGATVTVENGEVDGNITAKYMFFGASSYFYGTAFTVASGSTVDVLLGTQFYGTNPVISGGAGAVFDVHSWASFVGAGGTVTGPMVATVVGGYTRGAVPGSALTDANVTVSLDGGGSTTGFTTGGNLYTLPASTLSTNRILTLGTSGADHGFTMAVVRVDASASTYTIKNDAGTTLLVMSVPGSALFTYNGTHFALTKSDISASAGSVTWAGDLASSSGSAQYIGAISGAGGSGGSVTIGAAVTALAWAAAASGAGAAVAITGQAAHASSNANGGALSIASGAKDGSGTDGSLLLKVASLTQVTLTGTTTTIQGGAKGWVVATPGTFSMLYPTGVTPGTTNYSIGALNDGSLVALNASTTVELVGGSNGWKVASPGALSMLFASGVTPSTTNYTLAAATDGSIAALNASASVQIAGGGNGWIVSSPDAKCYLHPTGVTPSTSNYALVSTQTGTDVAIQGSTSATVTGGTTVALVAGGSTIIACQAGSISMTEPLILTNQGTASSASVGGGSALPALPAGYIIVSINGTSRKIPFFAT